MAVSMEQARQIFGRELREWRAHIAMTQQQLAKAIPISQAHVSAVERGTKGTSEDHIRRFDHALRANGALWERWKDLFRREGRFPDWAKDVADLEARASEIREYHPLVVPGLLQQAGYAEALIRSGNPTLTDPEVKERVELRVRRQALLEGEKVPVYTAIMDEPWLRRPLGGPEIMKNQLEHLLKLSQRPRITVQVIPTSTKMHPGIDGPFQLLTVPTEGQYLYTESRGTGRLSHNPEVVGDYTRVLGDLRGVSLPEEASHELIMKIHGDLDA